MVGLVGIVVDLLGLAEGLLVVGGAITLGRVVSRLRLVVAYAVVAKSSARSRFCTAAVVSFTNGSR